MQKNHLPLLTTVCLLCALEFLQAGMIAFGSVPIRGEIEASPEEYSLVAALYACVAVVVIAQQRWLIERIGWRNYTLGSIGIYVTGAVVCSLSSHLSIFAIGRVVMALGGGAFMTMARTMVNLIPPGPRRFSGVKAFAGGLAGGTAAAPLIASLAVTHDHWQAIFWVLILGAGVAGLLAWSFLPVDLPLQAQRSETSAPRVMLLSTGAFFLLYALQRSYYDFYNDTHIVIIVIVLAVLALYSFFHVERRHEHPLLRVRDLITPHYVYGVALFGFCYLLVGANNYMLPIFMQGGLGYAWETIGEFQSLGLAAALLTWVIMARLLPKHPSPRKFFVSGFLALVGFGWLLARLSPSAEMWHDILPPLLLNGCFIMLVLATTAMQTFADVGKEDTLFSHAQQVKTMLGQLMMAMGTALATVFMQWRSTVQYSALNVRLTPGDLVLANHLQGLSQGFALAHEASQSSQMAWARVGQEMVQQSTLLAGIEYFWLVGWIALLALVVSAVQRVFR